MLITVRTVSRRVRGMYVHTLSAYYRYVYNANSCSEYRFLSRGVARDSSLLYVQRTVYGRSETTRLPAYLGIRPANQPKCLVRG